MEAHSSHRPDHMPELKAFKTSSTLRAVLVALVVLGFGGFAISVGQNPERAWRAYLIGFELVLGVGLFGSFFTAMQHLTGSSWSVVIRRVIESFALTVPLIGLGMFGLFWGMHSLYEWSHVEVLAHDGILAGKSAYLNSSFFMIRSIVYLCIWSLFSFLIVSNSLKQDKTGAIGLSIVNRRLSTVFIMLFALSFCLSAFDWIMSLEPHWFSTIFGIYIFSGAVQSGFAVWILAVAFLYKKGLMTDFVNKDHFHDLGKFMFGFSVFWAYSGVSQFLLIWYADLPEETIYFIRRNDLGWTAVGYGLIIVKFAFPFFALLRMKLKRNINYLIGMAIVVFLSQWLDLFWCVMPSLGLHGEEGHVIGPVFGWQDCAPVIGFIAVFALVVTWIWERVPLVPIKDPRLQKSMHHHV